MSRATATLRTTLPLVIPVLLIVAAAWWFFFNLRAVNPHDDAKAAVSIPAGTGVRQIAQQLAQGGLIRNAFAFELAVGLAGLSKDLQAGTFELSRSMSATEIARALARGVGVKEVVLTIREGWTTKEIAQYVAQQGIGTEQEFISAASVRDSRTILPDDRFDFLAGRPASATLEGYLFPDTYRVFPDANAPEVVKKMLTNFGSKLSPELRSELTRNARTLFEVVTLASIVEREVRTDRDRALVADLFWRRLKAGIALQSDATVNFVTGKKVLQASSDDIAVDSPYNTYKYRGLPPGPIGNPGLSSILAVVRPEKNEFLYFLTDKGGTTHYAKTFEEHSENKRKFLQ